MSPHSHRPTAKIYQFPRRPSASPAKLDGDALAVARARTLPSIECGSGWYHDRAIEEGRTAPKS